MLSLDKKNITAEQLRAGRALVRWSAQDLADRAGVGVATVRRCEAETGFVSATQANKSAMRSALEAAGVVFIEENGGGAGVRLSQPNSHND